MIQIGTRGPGSMIGEMAMIDDKPRTATVRALDDLVVLEITREILPTGGERRSGDQDGDADCHRPLQGHARPDQFFPIHGLYARRGSRRKSDVSHDSAFTAFA